MGDGYTRQSAADIVTGNIVEAGPLNAEFNQLQAAMHESSGHSHDGTVGEGPKISLLSSVSGQLQAANGGTGGIHKLNGTTAPTVNEDSGDGYAVGSVWADVTNDKAYICVDSTVGAAVWRVIGTAGSILVDQVPAADRLPYYTGATTASLATFTSFGRSLVDDADATAARTTLGLAIGTNVQAYDADLAAIAGLTSAADKGIYFTGVGTAATYDLTSFARTLLDDANQAAMQSTLGLVPGTNVQAYDADLAALAALSGTNTIYYRSAANTWSAVAIGSGLTFTGGTLDAVVSSLDAELSAIAGLTSAADRLPYYTGSGTAALATYTSFARSLDDDPDAATARTTLGLAIGTDVQAFDADLSAVAGLSSNGLIARTGAGSAAARTLTAPAAGITVSNGDGVSGNPTLALANDLAALEALSGTDTLYYRSGADTWSAVTIGSGVTFSGGTLSASGGMTAVTPVATTSGAGTTGKSLSFPSGTKKITFMCNGLSTSAAGANAYIRLGDSGGAESSGYLGGNGIKYDGSVGLFTGSTTQISLGTVATATVLLYSTIELTLMDASTNKWHASVMSSTDNTYSYFAVYSKSLSAELTTVTVYFDTGNFDAGSISAVYSL